MDTIFTLPLFILSVLQAFITALHVAPGVGLPLSQALRSLTRSTASRSAIYTFMGALALLSASSLYELSKGADKIRSGNLRGEVMATVDYLRAQVSCALSLSNLLIMLLNIALSSERCKLDFTQKNLSAMQRQVKGLQAEYDRVTSAGAAKDGPAGSSSSGVAASLAAAAAEEATALKKTVDRLIAEKQQLQAAAEAAEAAAKSSEARVTAMVSQIKGFDKEFDRLLDENKVLKAQMQRTQQQQQQGAAPGGAAPAAAAAAGSGASKKDD
ncbi:hypothetical protein PLESTB_000882600 [Pleodorina starrii]|uniref:Endoplasmic reticulum transmembrane protein n=1 Tax=Pleodorina starrii TaxID=330485 RepID=A0A9W6BM21_9CHLO|nr:hypothetical protein PLESTM_001000400 [Pleodorina starrii]GLC54589.1 hypothetical protein PLESTB_000882600 [Pleodorina starrii]GLC67884.1 hypothetical protein PLESTF_000619000 [Pleodorina starrii]